MKITYNKNYRGYVCNHCGWADVTVRIKNPEKFVNVLEIAEKWSKESKK
jgi:hypothetical protein